MGQIELRMPGRFEVFFSGTSVGQGQLEKGNEAEHLAYAAYSDGVPRRTGRGSYLVLTIDVEPGMAAAVLDVFLDYVAAAVTANAEDGDPGETRAARTFAERLSAAYVELGADMTPFRRQQFHYAGMPVPRTA